MFDLAVDRFRRPEQSGRVLDEVTDTLRDRALLDAAARVRRRGVIKNTNGAIGKQMELTALRRKDLLLRVAHHPELPLRSPRSITCATSSVRIAMDDFGARLFQLFGYPKIPIDCSFINHMDDKADSIVISRAVTRLRVTLGISTTAESVVTVEQLRQLRLEGCTEAQGLLISKPRPASELAELLGQPTPSGKAAA